jgi:hypothetical protein
MPGVPLEQLLKQSAAELASLTADVVLLSESVDTLRIQVTDRRSAVQDAPAEGPTFDAASTLVANPSPKDAVPEQATDSRPRRAGHGRRGSFASARVHARIWTSAESPLAERFSSPNRSHGRVSASRRFLIGLAFTVVVAIVLTPLLIYWLHLFAGGH